MLVREPGSDTRKLLMETVTTRRTQLSRTIEIPTREGVFEAVAAGMGVTVSLDRERMFPDHVFREIDGRTGRRISPGGSGRNKAGYAASAPG